MAKSAVRSSDGQTISRAVAILNVLADKPGASFGQIAKATGLPRSTVQRLVGVLNNEGLVTKVFGQHGAYLGMELARLGAKVNLDIRSLLRPIMESLHEKVGDNIDLTMLKDNRVVVIEQIASNETIRIISYVGMQHALHGTANGKAHLSLLNPEARRDILPTPLEALTPQTKTDVSVLLDEISQCEKQKLFFDEEEFSDGVCAIATPLPKIGGLDLVVAVALPRQRYARRKEDICAALLEFSILIEDQFGASI